LRPPCGIAKDSDRRRELDMATDEAASAKACVIANTGSCAPCEESNGGVERSKRLEAWLDFIVESFPDRILYVDPVVDGSLERLRMPALQVA